MYYRFKKWKVPLIEVYKKYWYIPLYPVLKLLILAIKRNIKWLKIILKSKNSLYCVKVFSNKMYVNVSDVKYDIGEESIAKQLALDGIREPGATEYFRRYIKNCKVFFDIGANIGYYTLIAACEMPDKSLIYALEPSRKNMELLKRNILINGYEKKVKLFQLAVSNKKDKIDFFESPMSNLNTTYKSELINKKQIPFKNKYQVDAVTVDGFFADKNLPDFIKMDIEGAEVEVIDGMREVLSTAKKLTLFIEIHPQLLQNTKLMRDFLIKLKNFGFEIKVAVSHDDFYRKAVNISKIEHITISELVKDKRVVQGTTAFEVFFDKI